MNYTAWVSDYMTIDDTTITIKWGALSSAIMRSYRVEAHWLNASIENGAAQGKLLIKCFYGTGWMIIDISTMKTSSMPAVGHTHVYRVQLVV